MTSRYSPCEHDNQKDECRICRLEKALNNVNTLLCKKEDIALSLRRKIKELTKRVIELEGLLARKN